jgi:hypothetical protein
VLTRHALGTKHAKPDDADADSASGGSGGNGDGGVADDDDGGDAGGNLGPASGEGGGLAGGGRSAVHYSLAPGALSTNQKFAIGCAEAPPPTDCQ